MFMVQKHLKLKPRLGDNWRVGIQAAGHAFNLQGMYSNFRVCTHCCRVCIQDQKGTHSGCRPLIQPVLCVCEVDWLPIVQVFVAALRCQFCLSI